MNQVTNPIEARHYKNITITLAKDKSKDELQKTIHELSVRERVIAENRKAAGNC